MPLNKEYSIEPAPSIDWDDDLWSRILNRLIAALLHDLKNQMTGLTTLSEFIALSNPRNSESENLLLRTTRTAQSRILSLHRILSFNHTNEALCKPSEFLQNEKVLFQSVMAKSCSFSLRILESDSDFEVPQSLLLRTILGLLSGLYAHPCTRWDIKLELKNNVLILSCNLLNEELSLRGLAQGEDNNLLNKHCFWIRKHFPASQLENIGRIDGRVLTFQVDFSSGFLESIHTKPLIEKATRLVVTYGKKLCAQFNQACFAVGLQPIHFDSLPRLNEFLLKSKEFRFIFALVLPSHLQEPDDAFFRKLDGNPGVESVLLYPFGSHIKNMHPCLFHLPYGDSFDLLALKLNSLFPHE